MNERGTIITINDKRNKTVDLEGSIIDKLVMVKLYAECRIDPICV